MTNAIAAEIQSGANTHTHDQAITLHNFKTMNATVNRPHRPIPPLFVEEEF